MSSRDAHADDAVTLQATALLLDYPSPACTADLELIAAALAEAPRAPGRERLERFVAWWSGLGQSGREQRYVATFDLGDESVGLYLTERGHDDGSCAPEARGARLLALRRAYTALGVEVRGDELPDYLPLLLEVAAHVPQARALLGEHRPAVEWMAGELTARGDPFADVLAAVLAVPVPAHTAVPARTAFPATAPSEALP